MIIASALLNMLDHWSVFVTGRREKIGRRKAISIAACWPLLFIPLWVTPRRLAGAGAGRFLMQFMVQALGGTHGSSELLTLNMRCECSHPLLYQLGNLPGFQSQCHLPSINATSIS